MPKAPLLLRQALAEFLGTFFLVLIGDGAIAQATFKGEITFATIAFGYGFALMVGILVSGGVSGGHLNPAVSLTMACFKKLPWVALPVYMAAQYLGAFTGAGVLYGIYADAINQIDGKNSTAGIFASYPAEFSGESMDTPSTATLVMDQILGTAVLLIIISAVTDEKNMKVPSGLVPLLIGFGLTAIHLSLAFNAGCAINPARDFGPRLLSLAAGFGTETFTSFDYFFWIPWIMPHIGGLIGGIFYFLFIEMHHGETAV